MTAAYGDCCWLAAADSFRSPEIAAAGSSQSPPCLSLGKGSVWVRPTIPSRQRPQLCRPDVRVAHRQRKLLLPNYAGSRFYHAMLSLE